MPIIISAAFMNNSKSRIERAFEWLFDNRPTSMVYAIHMFVIGISNVIDDGSTVSRALIHVWDTPPTVVYLYMALIILASIGILVLKKPSFTWYIPGISYIILIITSTFTLAIFYPSVATFSIALRAFAVNGKGPKCD